MADQGQHLKEDSPVSHPILHKVPFTNSAAREIVNKPSGTRLDTISEDILFEEDLFLKPPPKRSPASNKQRDLECPRKSSNENSPPASSHSSSHEITQTPPAVLRKQIASMKTINSELEKELLELSDYTTLELQTFKAEKGLFDLTEENMNLKCELETIRETVKSKEDLISTLEETIKSKENLISSLEETIRASKSSYDAIFAENINIKKQFSDVENKLLEEGIKWEIAEIKWKNREEELKKSLEEAWTSLKVKDDRLTVLNEKIKERNERDIDTKINISFNKKDIKDNVEKLEEVDDINVFCAELELAQTNDSNVKHTAESQHNFEDELNKELEKCKSKPNEQQSSIEETVKNFSAKIEEKDKIIEELPSILRKYQSGVYNDLQDATAQTEFSDISLLTDLKTEIHSLQSEILSKQKLCEQQLEEIQDLNTKLRENNLLIVENNEHKVCKDNLIEFKNVIECTNDFLDNSVKAFNDKLSQKEIIISKLELFLKNIGHLISKHMVIPKQELNPSSYNDLSQIQEEVNCGEKNLPLDLFECVTCEKLKQEISILENESVMLHQKYTAKEAMIIEKKDNEITNLLSEIQNYKEQGCKEFKEKIEHITSKLALFELDLGSVLDKKEKSLKKLEDNFGAVKQIITDSVLPVSDTHLLGNNESNSRFSYEDVVSLKNKMEILNNNVSMLEEQLKNKINEKDQKLGEIENSVGILRVSVKENIRLTKGTSVNENEEQSVMLAANLSKSINIIDKTIVEVTLNIDQNGQKVQNEIDNNIKRIHNLESKISQLRQNLRRINDGKTCICLQERNASGDATALHANDGTLYFNPDSPRLMEMDFTMTHENRSHLNYIDMVSTETQVDIIDGEYNALEERNANQTAKLLWKQQESAFLNEIDQLQTKLQDQEKLAQDKEKELRSTIQELQRNKQKECEDILHKVEVIITEINKYDIRLKADLECKEQSLEKLEKQVALLTSQLEENYSKKKTEFKLMKSTGPKFKSHISNRSTSKMHHSLHEYPSNNTSVLCMSVYCESPEKNVDNTEYEQDLSTFISEDSQNEISVQQCLFEKSVFPSDLLGKEQVIMEDPLENSNVNIVLSESEDSDTSHFGTPLASHSEIQDHGFVHKIDDKVKLKLEYHQVQLENAVLTKDVSEYTNQIDKFKKDILLLETKLADLRTENEEYKSYVETYNGLLQSHTCLQSDYQHLELEMNSLLNKFQEQNNLLKEIPLCKQKILEINQLFDKNNSLTVDGSDLVTDLSILHNIIGNIVSEKNNLNERYSDLKQSHERQLVSDERNAEQCRNLMLETESLKEKCIQQSRSLDDLKIHMFKLNELFSEQDTEIANNDCTELNNRCIIIYNSVRDLISSKDELNIKYESLQKSLSEMVLGSESLNNQLSHLKEENALFYNLQSDYKNLESELHKVQEKCIQQEKSIHCVSEIRNCIINICNTFNISCDEVLEDENNLIFYLNNINNHLTYVVSQNTELNNKYNNVEHTCSELTQSLENLKEEYCDFKEKNSEVCKTLETEVQILNDKCTDQSKILLNTLTTIKDLLYETKHLFNIELNVSSEESSEKVVSYLKEFFQFATETASAKRELSDKCNQYYELNTNLELNIDNLKQKYEKLQSDYEAIKSDNLDKDEKKLQLKEKVNEILQLFNVHSNTNMLETINDEMECLKQLNTYFRQLMEENFSLKRNSEINKTELGAIKIMLDCDNCTSDVEVWSAIKNKIKLITESSNEKSYTSDHKLEEKIEKLETDLMDADSVKRKLAVELHGMDPRQSVYDLMKMPPQELYETFMNTLMKKEKTLIENIQNDCEAKITSYEENLNQLLEKEKRRQNWVQNLEKENEKLSEECKKLKLENDELNNDYSFPNRKESSGGSNFSEEVMMETKSGYCPKCQSLENSQIREERIPKEDLNSKILLEEKQREIKNLEIINNEKAIIIQELEAALSEKQKNYVDLITTTDGKQDSMNELQKKVNELMATVFSLETSLTEQRNLNDELKNNINEKLDLIKNFEKQAGELENQNSIITKYEDEISELNQKLEIAGSQLQDKHSKLMEDLSSKLNIIHNLQLELEIFTNKYKNMEQEMNSLNTLKKDLEEKQLVVCELRDKVSTLSQENVNLEEKLNNELLTNEQLTKERDEIQLKYERDSKVHRDEICPHNIAMEAKNREIVEINKKHKEQLDNFLLMKSNLEEDIEYKSAKIIELDNKLKTAYNIHKQAMIAKNELCEKLERSIQEYKEKDKRFDEKINIQRDMYTKEKKNLEVEINNKVKIINDLKENVKKLEIEIDSKNLQMKELDEKLKSQFDSFSNEIRLKNELICDLKEKLHLLETHNKEKLLLKREISNKEGIISDLKVKLAQSRKEIETSYIELTTLKNKILDLFSDKPTSIEDALIQIQKNFSEINDTNKQLEELKTKYTLLNEECDFISSDAKHYEKQLGLTYEELVQITSQLKEEQTKLEEIVAAKCQLEKELTDAKNEIFSNKPALASMEAKICELQNDIIEWGSKCVSLEEQKCELTRSLGDLKGDVLKLTDEISNKNWKIAKLENQLQAENKILQQKTDLLADYKTKVSKMNDENIKLQEKLDKIESVRTKETLMANEKSIQVPPNPKILGDIRNAQIRQFEERIEKLEKDRKIYKNLCQHRQKKIEELSKALNSLSVEKIPLSTSSLRSPLSNSK